MCLIWIHTVKFESVSKFFAENNVIIDISFSKAGWDLRFFWPNGGSDRISSGRPAGRGNLYICSCVPANLHSIDPYKIQKPFWRVPVPFSSNFSRSHACPDWVFGSVLLPGLSRPFYFRYFDLRSYCAFEQALWSLPAHVWEKAWSKEIWKNIKRGGRWREKMGYLLIGMQGFLF